LEVKQSYQASHRPASVWSDNEELSEDVDLADLVITSHQHEQQSRLRSPLDCYLSTEPTSNQDVLRFWQLHAEEYPDLAQMAMDVLAVPISGAGIERLFSAARQIYCYQHK
jgi:hypothetical protein